MQLELSAIVKYTIYAQVVFEMSPFGQTKTTIAAATANADANDAAELYRAIKSKAKNDLPEMSGPISFSDLMLFINITNTSVPLRQNFTANEANIATMLEIKKQTQRRKTVLELTLREHLNSLSKWVNFINGRRDRRRILMKDGINFLNFMHGKVDTSAYNYLVELYFVEKLLMMIKCYELEKIVYDAFNIDDVEYVAPMRYPKMKLGARERNAERGNVPYGNAPPHIVPVAANAVGRIFAARPVNRRGVPPPALPPVMVVNQQYDLYGRPIPARRQMRV